MSFLQINRRNRRKHKTEWVLLVYLTHRELTFKRRMFIPRCPHLCHEERTITEDVANDDHQRQFDGLQLGGGDRRRDLCTVAEGPSTAAALALPARPPVSGERLRCA